MRIAFRSAYLLALLALPVLGWGRLYAQAPLSSDSVYVRSETQVLSAEWRARAAKLALESGLSATAVTLYQALFEEMQADRALEGLRLDMVAALVAQERYAEAEEILQDLEPNTFNARHRLYSAVVSYGRDSVAFEPGSFGELLSQVDINALDRLDRPWLYLLQGVVADAKGSTQVARERFERAEESATSYLQRALFSSLVLRQAILSAPVDESLLVEIRQKLNSLSGQSAAFPFLREYAIALHIMGRDGEAIAALKAELEQEGAVYSRQERAELLLLKGLILGADSEAGWSALKELVRIGAEGEPTAIALQFLARAKGRNTDLMAFLNEIISRPEPHPLLAMLYYIRCQLAVARPETASIAEADALYLLEQFPGLNEITNVYRLLAYAALQRTPPQYRVAADYLLTLREQGEPTALEKYDLNRMIGDCYFMNRDYANAVDFYAAARASTASEKVKQEVFLRLVIAEIRSGMIESALEHVDEANLSGMMDPSDRWRAEWNIAQALQSSGEMARALDRLRFLISSGDVSSVPTGLDMRLRWLEAQLSLSAGEENVQQRIVPLLARLDSLPENALDPDETIRLRTELLLLQAQSFIEDGDSEAGFGVMGVIRSNFPESAAAERSFFSEAGYHASKGDFLSAQQILVDFVAAYPGSLLADQALLQASLHCERRGPESYSDAVLLLNQLVQDYPESSLVYNSRLRQGDLLRLMNDFAGAQLIYENLVNTYPGHELQHIAELSRADCMAALAQGDREQMLEAATVLERLIDVPGLPVDFQVEVGHKLGTILRGRGDDEDASEVFSLMTTRYMLDAQNAQSLGDVGRYWLSRTVFSLGEILEEANEIDEAKRLYRRLVAFNLPGRNLALDRVDRLQVGESR